MDRPERQHVVGIKIEGDTWNDIIGALRHITRHLQENGPGRELVSGGYGNGYIVIDKVNPDTTHDEYFERLDKWLEENQR